MTAVLELWNYRSIIDLMAAKGRPREFDETAVLDAAIDVFREHGFEGSSAAMLVQAMGIGRQSLYGSFGDKWQLYCAALRRYVNAEAQAHRLALRSVARAADGIKAMLDRVIAEAGHAWGSIRPASLAIAGRNWCASMTPWQRRSAMR